MNFVHIPKTAGSSICAVIGDDWHEHRRASETPEPRFAFVRHPLDRLVSAYQFMRGSTPEKLWRVADCSFREFIERDHLFLRSQSWWLDDDVRFIGRFERLHEDFTRISDKPLPHLQASRRRPWPEYFTDETRAIAEHRYAEDFARFGYERVH